MNLKKYFFLLGLSFFIVNLHSEDLEFLTTTTAAYTGEAGLTGGGAYIIPSGSNSYVGWVWFPYGFMLSPGDDSSFNVIPSVDGDINLNDGTLTITGDMILGSGTSILGDGRIDGNGHSIILTDKMSLNTTLSFVGDTILEGNNNQIILEDDAQIWVSNSVTVTLRNLIIKDAKDGVNGNFVMEGVKSYLTMDNCHLWMDNDLSFTQGKLHFHNDVVISGSSHKFSYSSTGSCHIATQSKLYVDHGVRFEYDPSEPFNRLIHMQDNTSHMYLNGSTFYSSGVGVKLTDGTLVFDSLVTLSANGQDVGTAMKIDNSLNTLGLPGANIKIYGYIDAN